MVSKGSHAVMLLHFFPDLAFVGVGWGKEGMKGLELSRICPLCLTCLLSFGWPLYS